MNQKLIVNTIRMGIGFVTVLGFIALLSVGLVRGVVSGRIAGVLVLAFIVLGLPLARFLNHAMLALLGRRQFNLPSLPPDDELRTRRLRRLKKQTGIYVICLPLAVASAISEHMWWATIGIAILGLLLIYGSVHSIKHLKNGVS